MNISIYLFNIHIIYIVVIHVEVLVLTVIYMIFIQAFHPINMIIYYSVHEIDEEDVIFIIMMITYAKCM